MKQEPVAAERQGASRRWRKFDPAQWHFALVPGPARERELDREVA